MKNTEHTCVKKNSEKNYFSVFLQVSQITNFWTWLVKNQKLKRELKYVFLFEKTIFFSENFSNEKVNTKFTTFRSNVNFRIYIKKASKTFQEVKKISVFLESFSFRKFNIFFQKKLRSNNFCDIHFFIDLLPNAKLK